MDKQFQTNEEAYRREVASSAPDIWDRIEKGIEISPVQKKKSGLNTRFLYFAIPAVAAAVVFIAVLPTLNNVRNKTASYSEMAAMDNSVQLKDESAYEAAAEAEEAYSDNVSEEACDETEEAFANGEAEGAALAGSTLIMQNAEPAAEAAAAESDAESADAVSGAFYGSNAKKRDPKINGVVILISVSDVTTDEDIKKLCEDKGLEIIYDYENFNMYALAVKKELSDKEGFCRELQEEYDFILEAFPDSEVSITHDD